MGNYLTMRKRRALLILCGFPPDRCWSATVRRGGTWRAQKLHLIPSRLTFPQSPQSFTRPFFFCVLKVSLWVTGYLFLVLLRIIMKMSKADTVCGAHLPIKLLWSGWHAVEYMDYTSDLLGYRQCCHHP